MSLLGRKTHPCARQLTRGGLPTRDERPFRFGPSAAPAIIRLGAILFSVGLRLALPVVALLVMVDVALALLGRVNAQLQLLSLAFPLKMFLTLVVFGWGTLLFPRLLRELSGHAWAAVRQVMGS